MIQFYVKANDQFLDALCNEIKQFCDTMQVKYAISKFQDDIPLQEQCNLLFYELKDKKDISLLENVKCQNEHTEIILMYPDPTYVYDGYTLHALGYIDYSNLSEDFQRLYPILKKAIKMAQSMYHYHSGFLNFDIHPMHVLYIESYRHDIYLHTKKMQLKIRGSLRNYVIDHEYLKLIQVHKSYIVNFAYVKEIVGNELILEQDIHIPIGEKYRDAINEAMKAVMK